MRSPDPFKYPTGKHVRKHGPRGYKNYPQYREWLRDEFRFRCVFCLQRETWGQLKGSFDIDHFVPQVLRPDLTEDYDNLLYACHTCNLEKSSRLLPDPQKIAYGKCLAVHDDGLIEPLNEDGEILIDELDLDAESKIKFRQMWLEIVCAVKDNTELLQKIMGWPLELPNLAKKIPPSGNSKPEGVASSWFELEKQGLLEALME